MDLPLISVPVQLPDVLPERFPYRDEGCELAPACLSCPFPHCVFEENRGKQKLRRKQRAERVWKLRESGKTTSEIARILGLSRRTVQRALKEAKAAVPLSLEGEA